MNAYSNISFPAVTKGRIGEQTIQTVNARDLHAFLEVGKDFSTWINDRIQQYKFVFSVDYTTYEDLRSPVSGSSKARAQKVTEYAISIDMAKELAMVERNDKGRAARRYFIECERRANAPRQERVALPPAYAGDARHMNRVRNAKLSLVSAVAQLDSLGVDVASINMATVLSFSRQLGSIAGGRS